MKEINASEITENITKESKIDGNKNVERNKLNN